MQRLFLPSSGAVWAVSQWVTQRAKFLCTPKAGTISPLCSVENFSLSNESVRHKITALHADQKQDWYNNIAQIAPSDIWKCGSTSQRDRVYMLDLTSPPMWQTPCLVLVSSPRHTWPGLTRPLPSWPWPWPQTTSLSSSGSLSQNHFRYLRLCHANSNSRETVLL